MVAIAGDRIEATQLVFVFHHNGLHRLQQHDRSGAEPGSGIRHRFHRGENRGDCRLVDRLLHGALRTGGDVALAKGWGIGRGVPEGQEFIVDPEQGERKTRHVEARHEFTALRL